MPPVLLLHCCLEVGNTALRRFFLFFSERVSPTYITRTKYNSTSGHWVWCRNTQEGVALVLCHYEKVLVLVNTPEYLVRTVCLVYEGEQPLTTTAVVGTRYLVPGSLFILVVLPVRASCDTQYEVSS